MQQNQSIPIPEDDQVEQQKQMSAPILALAFSSAIISFNGLILPVIGLVAGYVDSIIVIMVVGFCTYYTASLIVVHLGKSRSIQENILTHFNHDNIYYTAYSVIYWLSLIPIVALGVKTFCLLVQGLLGHYSVWIPILSSIIMLPVGTILVRYFRISQELMTFGNIGLAFFIVFMIWALITAPSTPKTVPLTGNWSIMAGALFTMFSPHNFLAQNMIKMKDRSQFQCIVKSTFLITSVFYIFCSMGSFAIVNRTPYLKNPQVISDYFPQGQWQVVTLEVIYIAVLISVAPNFIIVSMNRFFNILGQGLTSQIQAKEILYLVVLGAGILATILSGANLQLMFQLNGVVLGYLYIIVIPIWVHLKCVWYDRYSGHIKNDEVWNSKVVSSVCECQNSYRWKCLLYLELVFLATLLVAGLGLLVFTFIGIFSQNSRH